jgi:hypothetical protein
MLPNTFCIGAPKSATTSLYSYLVGNPEISLSIPKEPGFFSENVRGLEWYESCFPYTETTKVAIDFSTTYSQYPHFSGIPKKMHEAFPEARFIYIVRDPLERAISQYYFHRQLYRPATFEEAIKNEATIEPGLYYMQIEQYLDYFPLSRFLFLTTDELSLAPEAVTKRVCEFLGVAWCPSDYATRHNVTARTAPISIDVELLMGMRQKFLTDSRRFGNLTGIDVTPWLNNPRYQIELPQIIS